MGGVHILNKYDEYWVIRVHSMGFNIKNISDAIGYKKSSISNIYNILRKYKFYSKLKNNSLKNKRYDDYFIVRSYLSGYNIEDISLAIGIKQKTLIKYLRKHNVYEEKIIQYGISEIAKELGVSRQRVHQKVKKCQSPYIQYKRGRNKKTKDKERILKGLQ
jgi:DNA-binding transcriptional regulator GbsR (MarR family)